jgi:hypothetical protein
MSFVMNVADIYRCHVVILALGELDHPFSLSSRQTHPCTIYPYSRYTHLVILQRLLSSTFSGVIAFCHF